MSYLKTDKLYFVLNPFNEASKSSNIVSKIRNVKGLHYTSGCNMKQIKDAESSLGIKFPKEFVDYVKTFGAISFYGTEWTGLNINGPINVVTATNRERSLNPSFPEDCFVLENNDEYVTIVDKNGRVFELTNNKRKTICGSLSEYLDECIRR